MPLNGVAEPTPKGIPAERRLSNITPLPRQAFLLIALEGFSESDAAQILDISVPEVRALVEESGRELAADIATDVLIIEDEAFIAFDLEGLVESLRAPRHRHRPHAPGSARPRARKKPPGLILADIQLADGSSGIDAVNDLLESFEIPVIFITAYPERFLTGERPEPAFLIAKPYQPATVSAVLSQALFFERKATRRSGARWPSAHFQAATCRQSRLAGSIILSRQPYSRFAPGQTAAGCVMSSPIRQPLEIGRSAALAT